MLILCFILSFIKFIHSQVHSFTVFFGFFMALLDNSVSLLNTDTDGLNHEVYGGYAKPTSNKSGYIATNITSELEVHLLFLIELKF